MGGLVGVVARPSAPSGKNQRRGNGLPSATSLPSPGIFVMSGDWQEGSETRHGRPRTATRAASRAGSWNGCGRRMS